MEISENSRVWIYQSNRILNPNEQAEIQSSLDQFTSQWLAHGNKLAAIGEIRYNLFIIVSVDENQACATGCSIDKSVALMKAFELQFGINLFDRFQIAYREEENIVACNRESFERLVLDGKVNSDTTVFNNMVATRKELASNWEVPMKNSWHAQVFELNQDI